MAAHLHVACMLILTPASKHAGIGMQEVQGQHVRSSNNVQLSATPVMAAVTCRVHDFASACQNLKILCLLLDAGAHIPPIPAEVSHAGMV